MSKKIGALRSGILASRLSPRSMILFLSGGMVIFSYGMFAGIFWSEVIASLLEGCLGVVVASDAGLTALKMCELLSRLILACSGATTLMRKEEHPQKISSNKQVFIILVSGICK